MIRKTKIYMIPRKLTANELSIVSRNMFVLAFHACNDQGRNEVRWRPGQEVSLAPHVRTWGLSEANLLLKNVLVTLLGFFGVPIMIRRPGNCAPLAPLVTPLTTTAVHFTLYFVPFIETRFLPFYECLCSCSFADDAFCFIFVISAKHKRYLYF